MFRDTSSSLRWLLLLFLFGITATNLSAQISSGAIAGSVEDSTGAVIPDAAVTAINDATQIITAIKSTSAGAYRFASLPLGTYTVTAVAPGFSKATAIGVMVTISSTTSLDLKLMPGTVNETVQVDASGLRIETETSDISGTVSGKQIQDLPLSLAAGIGGLRSPETFMFLLPGTTGPGSGTSGNTGNGTFFARIAGGQAYGNEVLLDGASITRSENGSSFDETSPSIEALQEFKVTNSQPSAEFGRTTSGVESFATKNGTNSFRGTAYTIVKNRVFNANNWFNNGWKALRCQGVADVKCAYSRPKDSKYDFGGVISGPVLIPHIWDGHNKTFFLFSWEKYQYRPGGVITSTVPTPAEFTGDFSDVYNPANLVPGVTPYPGTNGVLWNPCDNQPVHYNELFDPTTSTNMGGGVFCRHSMVSLYGKNAIPSPYLSPTAASLMKGLPAALAGHYQTPTTTDVDGFAGNYAQTGVAPNNNTTYTIRIDQNMNERHKIFGTYNTRLNSKLTAVPSLPGDFNNNGYVQTFTTHYGRGGWDWTIAPNWLNHLNVGYNRTNSVNLSATFGTANTAASHGIAGDYSKFFPRLNFAGNDGMSSWGQQQNGINIDNGLRFNDTVSWMKGRHNIRFGVDYRIQRYSTNLFNIDHFDFYRDQTAGLSNACCHVGNSFASFLMGEVGNGGQDVYNSNPRWKSWYIAGFVQDDVKLTNNLTINVGFRYDLDVPRHEALNRTSNFSFTAPDAAAGGMPGALVFGANCNGCNTAWADTWYKDFAPRIGFAYSLPNSGGKIAVRGGAGIVYGPLQYNDFGSSMTLGYHINHGVSHGNTPTQGGQFTPAFRLDSTSPADPQFNSIGFPTTWSWTPNTDPTQLTAQNGPGSFQAVAGELILPKDGRPSMTTSWGLQIQDQIAQDFIVTLGYVGSASQNLRSGFLSNFNNISKSYFGLGDVLNNSFYDIPLGGTSQGYKAPYSTFMGHIGQSLRPFPQYDYIANDCCLENMGHSSYHAMVVSAQRHFRNGFNLQASYTWSKNLTDADSTIPFSYTNNNQREQAQDSVDLRNNKAVSVQDLTQQLSLSYLYQLPFGIGRKWMNQNRVLDAVLGGWQVGVIQRYASGQPIGFGCATGIPYYQNCIQYTAGPASYGTQDFASDAYKSNKNGPSVFNGKSWLKPAYRVAKTNGASDTGIPMEQAAFVDQNRFGPGWARPADTNCGKAPSYCSFTPFSLGNLSRMTEAVTGPPYKGEDLSLMKDFRIHETITFQLKGEAFDVLNRHRMALPDLQPRDTTQATGFGIPGSVDYGPRSMQVSGRISF
jgi:hypothetical protein